MIEVRVPGALVRNIDNEMNKINTLMRKLRDGGIPIVGQLVAWSIEYGSLLVAVDDVFDEYSYKWFDFGEDITA